MERSSKEANIEMGMKGIRVFSHIDHVRDFVRLFIDSNRSRSSQPQFFIDAMGINDIYTHKLMAKKAKEIERERVRERGGIRRNIS